MKRHNRSIPRNSILRQDHPLPMDISDNLRIDPEKRICPSYDYLSIAEYRVADKDKMGFRVIDNAVQEHIM